MLNFADKITPNPMDSKLQSEFLHLFNTMGIEEGLLDYAIADRHIKMLKDSPYLKTTAITLYDNCRRCHIYESDYHRHLFKDEDGYIRTTWTLWLKMPYPYSGIFSASKFISPTANLSDNTGSESTAYTNVLRKRCRS